MDMYNHLDSEVRHNLAALERSQPLKSAARKQVNARSTVLEVGAGEGRFSKPFSRKLGRRYTATDIAAQQGDTGFLSHAKNVVRKFGVDANNLAPHATPGSLSHVVGANPFGVKGTPGASYGLLRENPNQATGKHKWIPDPRFLSSAKPLLKPTGTAELYGRSNIIRDHAVSQVPSTGKGGSRTAEEQRQVAAAKAKYPGENSNPYLAISPDQLHALAKATGYRVKVKRARQPDNTAHGGNPDTKHGDKERAATGLKPFNTHFSFRAADDGYESNDDDPRVTYESGESDLDD